MDSRAPSVSSWKRFAINDIAQRYDILPSNIGQFHHYRSDPAVEATPAGLALDLPMMEIAYQLYHGPVFSLLGTDIHGRNLSRHG
jgi:hypothetical protein